MSEMDLYKGKIEEVKLDGVSLHDKVHSLCKESKYYEACYKDSQEDEYYEILQECTDNYMYANKTLYKYERVRYDDYLDIFDASKNEDGTISFNLKYYNGGCGFVEAIEIALDRMEK